MRQGRAGDPEDTRVSDQAKQEQQEQQAKQRDAKPDTPTVADLETEIAQLRQQQLDPKTNQPFSDFQPTVEGADAEAKQELARRSRRAGSLDAQFNAATRDVRLTEQTEAKRAAAQEALDLAKEQNQLPETQMAYVPPDVYKARQQAIVAAEAAANMQSTTVPGGVYRVGEELVNAYGDVVTESGEIKERRHRPISG